MYKLYSWGSHLEDKGLYSFDPACLSIQTYLEFSNADWQLHKMKNSDISTTGRLPALSYKTTAFESGFWHIIEFLKRNGHDLDLNLDKNQMAQSTSYISLIQDRLADALLFSWYAVEENFTEAVRPQLARHFGFPLSLVMPTQLKTNADERLQAHDILSTNNDTSKQNNSATSDSIRSRIPKIYLLAKGGFKKGKDMSSHAIFKMADECLNALSQKLGKKEFFFGGTEPTTLDAVAYAYLSLMVYPDLPQSTLRSIITSRYVNLLEFCDRVHSRMAAPDVVDEGSLVGNLGSLVKSALPSCTVVVSPPSADQERIKDPQYVQRVKSVTAAFCVFFGYVIYNGILSAPSSVARSS